jgi:hypothetical protein
MRKNTASTKALPTMESPASFRERGIRTTSTEIIVQLSIFMIALSPSAYGYIPSDSGAYAVQYPVILGPIFLTVLLMFVSGLMLRGWPGAKKRYESGQGWQQYQRWTERTSILVPFPPQLYAPLPTFLKRTFVFGISDICIRSGKACGSEEGVRSRSREREE